MSDLFETFVFDLQRFVEAKYGEIGASLADKKQYTWGISRQFYIFDDTNGATVNAANAMIAFSLSGTSYVGQVTGVTPDKSSTSIIFSNNTAAGQSAIKFVTGGGLSFGMRTSGATPQKVTFSDANDQVTLDDYALGLFGGASAINFQNQNFEDKLAGFDLNDLAANGADETLKLADADGNFELSGLSAGAKFTFVSDLNIEFAGSDTQSEGGPSYFGNATAGGTVGFNLEKDLNITVDEGGIALVGTGAALSGISAANGVTVNGAALKLDVTGFAYDNTSADAPILYFTDASFSEAGTSDELEKQVRSFTIGSVSASVKGLSQDYSGFILDTDKAIKGFVFAAADSAATLILNSEIPDGFSIYAEGYDSDKTAATVPQVTGSNIAAIKKSTVNDEVQLALIVDDGALVTDENGTSIIVSGAGASYVSVVFDPETGKIKGVMPSADPTSSEEDPADFWKGLTFNVSTSASTYDTWQKNGLSFGGAEIYGTSAAYVAIGSGQFTYEKGSVEITLSESDETVFAVDSATAVKVASGEGTLVDATDGDTDSEGDPTYSYNNASGSAYFKVNAEAEEYKISGFVFAGQGDALTMDSNVPEGFGMSFIGADNAETAFAETPNVSASSYTVEMTEEYSDDTGVAEFAVKDFSESGAGVSFAGGKFTFGDEADEFYFNSDGEAIGFSGNATVAMDATAAGFLAGGSFAVNGTPVNITAVVAGESLIFNAYDDGEQSLLGLSSGSKIADAGDITKIYGANGDNDLTVGETKYEYSAAGSSAGDLAYFNVSGSTATGFTFVTEKDALKVTADMQEAGFSIADAELGDIDTPAVYGSDGELKEEYTLTKMADPNYSMSGFEQGDYAEIGSGSIAFEALAEGSSAAIIFDAETSEIGGVSYLATDDAVRVNGISSALNLDGDTVEIDSDSYLYTKTDDGSTITDVYADATIKQIGSASYVGTASGVNGVGEYTFALGETEQLFGVSAVDATDGVDGVQFMIGSDSTVTAINGVNAQEAVYGTSAAFADVTSVNGQSFAVSGADMLGVLGNEGEDAVDQIAVFGGSDVVVEQTAGASFVGAVAVDKIAFGTGSAFEIAGESTTEVGFYLDGLTVTGVSYVGATESVTGYFDDVTAVNGVSFAVDDVDDIMIVGSETEDAISKIANVSDSAVINYVGGASQVITDTDGTFEFAGNSAPFTVAGDAEVIFQMAEGEDALVEGVAEFGNEGTSATLSGMLQGLTINNSAMSIVIDGDSDKIFDYMVDASGSNATLGGVGNDDGDVVTITETAGAQFVQTSASGVFVFKSGESFATNDDSVTFKLNDDGEVVAIYGLDDGKTISGGFSTNAIEIFGEDGDNATVKVVNDPDGIVVENDAIIIRNLSNGASISVAEDVTNAWTDALSGDSIAITDADGHSYTVEGGVDADGVNFLLDGHGHINGVSSLGEGIVLRGSFDGLSSVNGQTFDVTEVPANKAGDGQFAIVGASGNAIGSIIELGGMVVVANAGGASLLQSDDNVLIINAAASQMFLAVGIDSVNDKPVKSDGIDFLLTGEKVTAIKGISGNEVVFLGNDSGVTSVNGQSLAVNGASVAVLGRDGEDGIMAIGVLAGESVAITKAAGASAVFTQNVDQITFGESSTFQISGESDTNIGFAINDALEVKGISYIGANESVKGYFNDIDFVNGVDTFKIQDKDELTVVGNEAEDGLTKIANVSDSAVITDVAGASQVITDENGTFTFASASQVFEVYEGDSSITFGMDGNAVNAITGLSFGVVISENLSGVSVNGKTFDIKGDEGELAVAALSEDGIDVIARVGGASVVINSAGGASYVITDKAGTFTFAKDGRTFTTAGDSLIAFVLDGDEVVTSIGNADKGASITGDFSKAVAFAGYSVVGGGSGYGEVTAIVQIANDPDVMVVHDGFEVHMLSDGASISSATTVIDAYTDAASDTLKVTDASGDEFVVAGDSNGVHYILDGKGEIIGIDDLDEGATLGGALGALSSINGKTFGITETYDATISAGDGVFSVVGAQSGIGEVVGLSGGVIVTDAAGASVLRADGNIFLVNGAASQFFAVVGFSGSVDDPYAIDKYGSDGSNFQLDKDGKVIAVDGIGDNEVIFAFDNAFDDVTVNGKQLKVTGDDDELALVGKGKGAQGDGITAILGVGGSAGVVITETAGASYVLTNMATEITFGASSTFTVAGDSSVVTVQFTLDGLSVVAVDGIGANESVTGDFNEVTAVNGVDTFKIQDKDELTVVGNEAEDGLTKIANVSDSAVITDVAGASQVITDENGTFTFASASQVFTVYEGDSSITFGMEGNAVNAITGLSFGVVISENLSGVSVNGQTVDIKGDEDELAVAALSEDGIDVIARVGGASVVINSAGGASYVITDKAGTFTFAKDGRKFTTAGDSLIAFVLDGDEVVTSIVNADKGASITGDFSKAVAFAGYSAADSKGAGEVTATVQIANDPYVMVVHDGFEVHMLSDGASISSATTVIDAYTDAASDTLKVTDASGDEFVVAGDSNGVHYILDGKGEIIGIDDLDEGATLGGALGALSSINGKTFGITETYDATISAGDGKFSVVGAAGASGIGEVVGLSGLVTVTDAAGASVLRSDGNIALLNVAGGQSFMALGGSNTASDGVNFYLNGASINAIDGIGDKEVVIGSSFDGVEKLNSEEFKVINDADNLAVLGKDDEKGIAAIIGVGNTEGASIVAAAGASFVLSDSKGALTFGSGSSAETFSLDASTDSIGVGFYINDNVAVEEIAFLDKTDSVLGDFSDGLLVNGDSIKATDDVDQVIGVVGNDSWSGVSELYVQANATVTAWGSATSVNAMGAGEYVFVGADNATQTYIAADTTDSLFTFVTDADKVTGVEELIDGYIRFNPNETGSASLNVNVAEVAGQTMTFASDNNVSLTVDPYEVVLIEGVTGSVSGVVGKETPATVVGVSGITDITINGKPISVVEDGTTQFNVVVHDTEPDYVYDVQGDATVDAENVSVRANSTGSAHESESNFIIGGESYVMDDTKDENDGFTFVTGASGVMTGVYSLEGALVINDGEWAGTINGDEFEVIDYPNDVNPPVTVNSGVSGIESVGGLDHKDSVNGDLGAAQVHIPGYGEEGGHYPGTTITINGKPYTVVRDVDGVDVTGDDADVITDLDNQSSLIGAEGPVTVNGTALEPEEGDVIKGDRDDNSHARIVGDDELIRQATAINHYNHQGYDVDTEETTAAAFNIEDVVGLPVYTAAPTYYLDREDTDAILAGSSTYDFNQPLIVSLYNIDPDTYEPYKTEQVFDMSSYSYTKKVYMNGEGPQAVKFNSEGGNLAIVAAGSTGVKNVSLGAGGDAVVMDEDYALQNAVYIYGGTGDDSVFVRHNANTYIDFSQGGEDVLITAGEANARVTIAGYQASTGAAIRVEEYLDVEQETAGTIADGIENGIISFAEGTVIITSDEGRSEVYVGTNGNGGQIVNLMTHATSGNDIPQAVGFTGEDGGVVDGSTFTSPLIMIGNKDNDKNGGSSLYGGSANDTFYGGEDDFISTGYGNDLVKLYDDDERGGAIVDIGGGRTTIEGANNTLADSTGDVIALEIDPNDRTFAINYDDSLGTLEIEGAGYYAVLTDVDTLEGNYTTQYIYDETGDELYSVAIGTENSTIQVTEDEDLRPNVFFGTNTAIDFRNYTGDAIIDLKGDLSESLIDETIVLLDDDITTLYAGAGDMAFKGDDDDDTFFAGKGNTWLYGDGGKNLLVGYTGADKEGQTVFYVLGNADGAANTIAGFNFVNDDNYTDTKKVTADALEFDLDDNEITRIDISGNDLVFEITDRAGSDTESALLLGAINDDGTGNDFIVSDNVAQVADDHLVFDQFADYYYATGKNAVVEVSGRIEDDVILWLDEDETGKVFEGDIKYIDATNSDATAQLVGNDNDNVIYAGTGETSLWGGEDGNDVLVGNSGGRDTFFYSFGNGDDTITNVKDGDLIALDVSLDQIDEIDMSDATAIRIIMNDGDVLTINDAGHDVGIMVDNGEDGIDTYSTKEARSMQ